MPVPLEASLDFQFATAPELRLLALPVRVRPQRLFV